MPEKIPVYIFQVRGQFAHWRKWFTTTSALTYSFPPRTSIIGMVGAILGIPRSELAKVFPKESTRIAVCPLRPIVKDRLPEKWRQGPPYLLEGKFDPTKMNESFQQNLEVIRRPHYRIIFWHQRKDLMEELAERLQQKRWVYPPYLGIMGFLADVEWEDEDVAEEGRVKQADIFSVLPLSEKTAKMVDLSESKKIIREERVPYEVFPDRTFRHLYLAYISREAEPLKLKSNSELPIFRLHKHSYKDSDQIIFYESC